MLISFSKPNTFLNSDTSQHIYSPQDKDTFQLNLNEIHSQGFEPTLVVLDAGLVSELSPAHISLFRKVIEAGSRLDGKQIGHLMVDHSKDPTSVYKPHEAIDLMQKIIESVQLDSQGQLLLSQVYSSQVVKKFTQFLQNHRIRMDGEFISVSIACLLVEGIGRKLDGNIDLLECLTLHL